MVALNWNRSGEKVYESGVDRGVLYMGNDSAVVWNGLTSIVENSGDDKAVPYYIDGIKYFNDRPVTEYAAVLKAFTYPDEFSQFDGFQEPTIGLFLDEQPVTKYFGLSYRTGVGNDVKGNDFGYKIHILQNLTATPTNKTYTTMNTSTDALEFSWDIVGLPIEVEGYRASSHIVLNTRYLFSSAVKNIEDCLYGTDSSEPRIPTISELIDMIFHLVDNGDGTWTATGSFETVQYMTPTQFQITWPGITMIDQDTYILSNNP